MFDIYLWVKALHLIAVIFWMAGLLMLPRFFVYHSQAVKGGELEQQMLDAERRLLKIIRKQFEVGERPKSEKFFRMINEIPAIIAIIIVILAIVKPF